MKLNDLLRQYGCTLSREGALHALWINPATGHQEAVSRHMEISNVLTPKICRCLSAPEIGRENK